MANIFTGNSGRNVFHSALLGLAGLCLILIGHMTRTVPWSVFQEPLLLTVLGLAVLGFFAAVRPAIDIGRAILHPGSTLRKAWFAFALAAGTLLPGVWYGFALDGFQAWPFRAALALVLSTAGVFFLACAMVRARPLSGVIERGFHPWWTLPKMLAGSFLIAAGFSFYAMETMPHMQDATTYALQARILLTGDIGYNAGDDGALAPFLSLLTSGENGYSGKYPFGWPAILALFTAVGLPWLANIAVMLCLGTVCFHLGRHFADRRTALTFTALVLFAPWTIAAASSFLSHMASALWLTLFYLAYDKCAVPDAPKPSKPDAGALGFSTLAGLSLGLAILTRPFDAFFFALPVTLHAALRIRHDTGAWLVRMAPLAALALLALVAQLVINDRLTGAVGSTTYGHASYVESLWAMMTQDADSVFDYLAWFHQQLSELGARYTGGTLSAIALAAFGLFCGGGLIRRARLFFYCNLALLVAYGLTIFKSTTWYGPRWYVPLIPAIALLVTNGLIRCAAVVKAGREKDRNAAEFFRALTIASFAAGLAVILPYRAVEFAGAYIHGTSRALETHVAALKPEPSVILLPRGIADGRGEIHGKSIRSVQWQTRFPFRANPVLYLEDRPAGRSVVCRRFPNRAIYWMSDRPNDWTLYPVQCHKTSGPPHGTQSGTQAK